MLSRFIFKYKGFITEGGQGHRQQARGPEAQMEADVWASWLPGAVASPMVPCLCLGPFARCQEAQVAVRGAGCGAEGADSHNHTTLAHLLLGATCLSNLRGGRWLRLPCRCIGGTLHSHVSFKKLREEKICFLYLLTNLPFPVLFIFPQRSEFSSGINSLQLEKLPLACR